MRQKRNRKNQFHVKAVFVKKPEEKEEIQDEVLYNEFEEKICIVPKQKIYLPGERLLEQVYKDSLKF